MIERIPLNLTNINSSFSHLNNFNFVPTLFALTHPVNEISPFLILKQGIDKNEKVNIFMFF